MLIDIVSLLVFVRSVHCLICCYILQKMEILPVNDLDKALHEFVNKDDKMAFYSCVQLNLEETRVSIIFCFCCCRGITLSCHLLSQLSCLLTVSQLLMLLCECYVSVTLMCQYCFAYEHVQNKIARDSDTSKCEEEDLILKVGECLEARSYLLQLVILII